MAICPSSIALKQTEESDWSYAGWRVVLAAHLGVMAGFGSLFVYTFSIFLKPLSSQFGWSREADSAWVPSRWAFARQRSAAPWTGSLPDELSCLAWQFLASDSPRWVFSVRACGSSMPPASGWVLLATAQPNWPIPGRLSPGFTNALAWPWPS